MGADQVGELETTRLGTSSPISSRRSLGGESGRRRANQAGSLPSAARPFRWNIAGQAQPTGQTMPRRRCSFCGHVLVSIPELRKGKEYCGGASCRQARRGLV